MLARRVLLFLANDEFSRGIATGVKAYIDAADMPWDLELVAREAFDHATPCLDGALGCIGQFGQLGKEFIRRRLPAVAIGGGRMFANIPHIASDHEAVGRLAASFFIDRGYRNLLLAGLSNADWVEARERAVRACAASAGINIDHLKLSHPTWLRAEDEAAIGKQMAAMSRPLAVIATNEGMGLAIIRISRAAGLRVPEDVAVLNLCENDSGVVLSTPGLSMIRTAAMAMGRTAADLLARRLTGGPVPTDPVRLPPVGMVERGSTDRFAVVDPQVAGLARAIEREALTGTTVTGLMIRHGHSSRRSLERAFRRELGRSPGEELARIRHQHVRRLLIESDLTIAAIARHCGYRGASELARAFTRREGQRPSQFRNAMRGIVQDQDPRIDV